MNVQVKLSAVKLCTPTGVPADEQHSLYSGAEAEQWNVPSFDFEAAQQKAQVEQEEQ